MSCIRRMTVVGTVLLTGAIAAGAASAAVDSRSPAAGETLSPRLLALSQPTLRNAPRAQQAQALSLTASGPGSLLRQDAGWSSRPASTGRSAATRTPCAAPARP